MTKAKDNIKKVKVSNMGNSKPPQWNGKKGNSYLMWTIKYQAHMVMLGLEEALSSDFASKLPAIAKDVFNLTTKQGQKWAKAVKKNKKSNHAICVLLSESGLTKQTQSCYKSR